MKNLFYLLSFFIIGNSFAQQEKYSRIKIDFLNNTSLAKLHEIGVCIDHGKHYKDKSFETELSQTEIQLLKKSAINYTVLVEDVVSDFLKGNNTLAKTSNSCDNDLDITPPVNFSFGSMGGYFTYQQMLNQLDLMQSMYPNLITVKDSLPTTPEGISTSHEGRPLWFVKISNNANTDEEEPEMIYTALHHAREPGSLSQTIYYMWHLLENYGTDEMATALLNNTELFFVPCLNPDGYVYNETTNPNGGGMWRKNRKNNGDGTYGVDLNRNYPYHWGYDDAGSSPITSSQTYRGPSAGSEPEIKLITNFVNQHNFKFALNYHTYGGLLIHPWGFSDSHTVDSNEFLGWSKHLTSLNDYTYGTGSQTVGYTVNGDSDDWYYGDTTHNKIYVWTPEAGESFWPNQQAIIPFCEDNLKPNLWTASYLLNYARAKNTYSATINSTNFSINTLLTRLGLEDNGTFTIGYANYNTAQINVPFNWNTTSPLNLLDTISHQSNFQVLNSVPENTTINFDITVDNGYFKENYPISIVYKPNAADVADDFSTDTNWIGDWGLDNTKYTSSPYSIGDSPNSFYGNNQTSTYTYKKTVDLTNATNAYVTMNISFDIEKDYDYVQFRAEDLDNNQSTNLCGLYTELGTFNQDFEENLYHGKSLSWKQEEVSLNDFLGEKLELSFYFKSDQFSTGQGFNFDDFKIYIQNNISVNELDNLIEISPNPVHTNLQINKIDFVKEVEVISSTGQKVLKINKVTNSISLESLPTGLYQILLYTDKGIVRKKIIKS